MITVTDLRKAYGSNVAVDGVSFDIKSAETFGLLGPNGAGKTTTMHILVGALKADGGCIEIAGTGDPTQAKARRTIGIAPQATSLYEDLTGTENVRFFGALYGLNGTALRERVTAALEFVGLLDRGKDLVSTYSGGMKRRLNIAAAVVADPQVILFDEPTVGVDPQSRNSIFDNIDELKRRGKTILYTTHYMEEAQRLCDRVAIMDHGRILALDNVDRLIEAHGGSSVVEVELAEDQTCPPEYVASLVNGAPADSEPADAPRTLRIDTADSDAAVKRLIESGVRFTALRIKRPDLESVFLNLTGRRLRD
jgi:ABC-2 type transport system ATP-binding protein